MLLVEYNWFWEKTWQFSLKRQVICEFLTFANALKNCAEDREQQRIALEQFKNGSSPDIDPFKALASKYDR